MKERKYVHPGYANALSVEEVSREDRVTQKEIMEEWLRSHYRHPAEDTPVDSGEFVWIYGRHYPEEVLQEEFGGIVPDDVISELASELSDESYEWAGVPPDENENE